MRFRGGYQTEHDAWHEERVRLRERKEAEARRRADREDRRLNGNMNVLDMARDLWLALRGK